MQDEFSFKCDLCGKMSESVFHWNGWQVLCYYCLTRSKEEWHDDNSGRASE